MSYLDLTQRFPLRPIKDDAGLDRASALCDELISRDLDDDEDDYLNVLGLLIEDYEDKHVPMPDVSEADMLRYLIEARVTTADEVAEATGIRRARLADVMEDDRHALLTRGEIAALANHFKVKPSLFID